MSSPSIGKDLILNTEGAYYFNPSNVNTRSITYLRITTVVGALFLVVSALPLAGHTLCCVELNYLSLNGSIFFSSVSVVFLAVSSCSLARQKPVLELESPHMFLKLHESVNDHIHGEEDDTDEWVTFLRKTHQNFEVQYPNQDGEIGKYPLDWSVQIQRVQQKGPQAREALKIEELAQPTSEEREMITLALKDSFGGYVSWVGLEKDERCFVARTRDNAIVGVLFAKQQESLLLKDPVIFIHSLARRAYASKMGVLEALGRHLLTHQNNLFPGCNFAECSVHPENPMKKTYQRFGFQYVDAKASLTPQEEDASLVNQEGKMVYFMRLDLSLLNS